LDGNAAAFQALLYAGLTEAVRALHSRAKAQPSDHVPVTMELT
jgi:hypothetical protein